ncbi:MAG: serine/threonine-protein kinase [Planctomycetota bacterium]
MEQKSSLPSAVGEYEVVRSLGRGLMGEVYLARTGKVFHALKILDNTRAQRLDIIPKFISDISHENILQYKSVKFDSKYQHYFVSEFLEVRPISFRRMKPEGHKKILPLFIKAAKALAVAHSKGIIHGNIKPTNLLVRRSEDGGYMPIISDFCLCYIYDKDFFAGDILKKSCYYMSPEYIGYLTTSSAKPELPESITPASDVYSLAAVLADVLTGKLLYDDEDFIDLKSLLDAKERKRFRLIAVNHPSASLNIKALNDIVNKALAFSAKDRFKDMEEFTNALESITAEEK